MVHAGLGLAHAEIHHIFAVLGVHAHGPVFDTDPAFTAPTKQALDLRADIGELHGRPVDLPGNGLGGFQQGSIDRTLVLELAHVGHNPSLSRSQSIKHQAGCGAGLDPAHQTAEPAVFHTQKARGTAQSPLAGDCCAGCRNSRYALTILAEIIRMVHCRRSSSVAAKPSCAATKWPG